MYVHSVVGTGRYTTSTTNMYNQDFTYLVVVDHRLETIQMPHRHQDMQWFHGVEDGCTACEK